MGSHPNEEEPMTDKAVLALVTSKGVRASDIAQKLGAPVAEVREVLHHAEREGVIRRHDCVWLKS
jgi:predicted ArsR family transcriptional regulator